MFERASALSVALGKGRLDGSDGRGHLRMGELTGFSLIQIAVFPGLLPELERVIAPFLEMRLPAGSSAARTLGGRIVFKTGPGQFWIVSPEDDNPGRALQSLISPAIGAVTSLSHSRTRLFLEGSAARRVLATTVALDLHPNVFHVGSFALIGIHHTPVLLYRSGGDQYELYVMRTFAIWIWKWLIDAALPHGHDVDSDA